MAEFDESVSCDGVIVAGRIGSDWRVAEHKAVGLFIEVPSAFEDDELILCVDSNDAQHDGARDDPRCPLAGSR